MKILARYLSVRFIGAFLASLLILALVVTIVDMLLNLDDLIEAQSGFWGSLSFVVVRTGAQYLPYLVPVSCFVGVFITLGSAARHNEILALKVGGISPLRASLPVMALCTAVAAGSLILHERITVPFAAAIAKQEGGPRGELSIDPSAIWLHAGRFIFHTPHLESDDKRIVDVRIFERNARGRLVRFLRADKATLVSPRRIALVNASIRSFDPNHPDAQPSLRHVGHITLDLADQDIPLLAEQLPGLPIGTIAAHVRAVLAAGRSPARARLALHARLSQPLLVLILGLLAVPLGLAVEHTRSLARPSLQGVGLAAALLLTRDYANGFAAASGNAELALFVPWLVLAAFGTLSLWLLKRTPR